METALIQYRLANISDAVQISDLILHVHKHNSVEVFSAEGEKFLKKLRSAKAIEYYLTNDNDYVYFVAEFESRIIGVIGVRDNCYIENNYVSAQHQGQGISSRLWELAREKCLQRGNPGKFELRASTYAIPIYEHWGFVKESEAQDTGGIISTLMRLKLELDE